MLERHRVLHLVAIVSVLAALSAGPQVARAQLSAVSSAAPSAPTTAFVVNSLADAPDADLGNPACATAGAVCTFRAAVQQANATAAADTISFSVTGIITLTSATPFITETLTIVGPGPAQLTIDADGTGPVLWGYTLLPSVNLTVSGLTLTGGLYDEGGGVAFSGSTLVISDTVITNNVGDFGGGLSVYGAASLINSTVSHNRAFSQGGGIYSLGPLEIINCQIQENEQRLPTSGLSGQGLSGFGGGGLYASGQLTLTNSLVLSNTAEVLVALAGAAEAQPAAPAGPFGAGLYVADTAALIRGSVIAGNAFVTCITCTLPVGIAAWGGGLFSNNGNVTLEDSQVLSNTAQFGGGLVNNAGALSLLRTLVAGNRASQAGGIGSNTGLTLITESTVRDNWATAGFGGGLDAFNGLVSVSLSRFIGNQASGNGGGLYLNGANVLISYSQIEGNASGHAPPTVNAVAEPQVASDQGGGLYILVGSVNIDESAIVSNTATLGGGISSGGSLNLKNVTISGNAANRDGGGIELAQPPVLASGLVAGGFVTVTADLLHVTLAGNVADADNNGSGDGGGIFASVTTTPTLHSTLLANVDRGGQAPDCAGVVLTSGYNLIQASAGCTLAATTGDQFNVASGVQPLANYGGPTLTNALAFDSLALDAADPTECLSADQREVQRPFGAGCDIGAYELAGLFLPLLLR